MIWIATQNAHPVGDLAQGVNCRPEEVRYPGCHSNEQLSYWRQRGQKAPSFSHCQNHGVPQPHSLYLDESPLFRVWSSLIYPPCVQPGLQSRGHIRGTGWWVQKHGIRGEVSLSASKAFSWQRGDKQEQVNENCHGRWFMKFEEKGKRCGVWVMGRKGLGESQRRETMVSVGRFCTKLRPLTDPLSDS